MKRKEGWYKDENSKSIHLLPIPTDTPTHKFTRILKHAAVIQ